MEVPRVTFGRISSACLNVEMLVHGAVVVLRSCCWRQDVAALSCTTSASSPVTVTAMLSGGLLRRSESEYGRLLVCSCVRVQFQCGFRLVSKC